MRNTCFTLDLNPNTLGCRASQFNLKHKSNMENNVAFIVRLSDIILHPSSFSLIFLIMMSFPPVCLGHADVFYRDVILFEAFTGCAAAAGLQTLRLRKSGPNSRSPCLHPHRSNVECTGWLGDNFKNNQKICGEALMRQCTEGNLPYFTFHSEQCECYYINNIIRLFRGIWQINMKPLITLIKMVLDESD